MTRPLAALRRPNEIEPEEIEENEALEGEAA
jgi:hypothetical protein